MFDQTVQRVGFACKIQESHDKAKPQLNTKTTTISYLQRQTQTQAYDKLWSLLEHNMAALKGQVEWVSMQPPQQRMFRLSSDILPAYTHEAYMEFYFQPTVVHYLETKLSVIGNHARAHDVRLSFHPGQFCVLASENPQTVENSIREFEYHADLARYMGYGKQFQDFKCNVHVGGKLGPQGIIAAIRRLSRVARNILTIENAEYTWGVPASLELVDHCALVLDIHHHWCATGEYITHRDPRWARLLESWRGVRPVIHYSCSREDVLADHCEATRPDLAKLKAAGYTTAKLRAHSDYYWNAAVNEWALEWSPHADIMLEAKQKNLAQQKLLEEVT